MRKFVLKGNRVNSLTDKVSLGVAQVRTLGLQEGDRVTVRVKVGKKRKLFNATLQTFVDRCCGDPAHAAVVDFFVVRGT